MNLEPVIQSEVSQRKISYINAYMLNLEKYYWWTCLHRGNADADVENTPVDIAGEREAGRNWKSSTDVYTVCLLSNKLGVINARSWGALLCFSGQHKASAYSVFFKLINMRSFCILVSLLWHTKCYCFIKALHTVFIKKPQIVFSPSATPSSSLVLVICPEYHFPIAYPLDFKFFFFCKTGI